MSGFSAMGTGHSPTDPSRLAPRGLVSAASGWPALVPITVWLSAFKYDMGSFGDFGPSENSDAACFRFHFMAKSSKAMEAKMSIQAWSGRRRGAGIVEYGILIGLIAIVALVAVERSGGRISQLMNAASGEISASANTIAAATGGDAGNARAEPACTSPGDTCGDGSILVGPDTTGSYNLYIATAAQQEWARSDTFAWSGNWGDDRNVTSGNGAEDIYDGAQNAADIIAFGVANGGSDFPAAQRCDSSSAHGRGDWYLPAKKEANPIGSAIDSGAITSVPTGQPGYWTSTENTPTAATHQFLSGGNGANGKDTQRRVLCVRKEPL